METNQTPALPIASWNLRALLWNLSQVEHTSTKYQLFALLPSKGCYINIWQWKQSKIGTHVLACVPADTTQSQALWPSAYDSFLFFKLIIGIRELYISNHTQSEQAYSKKAKLL